MKKNRGASLLELTIAMMVGSIVLSSAFQAQRYFKAGAERERVKTVLQQHVITAAEMISKDIRQAGYGLQGNTISVELNSSSSDCFNVLYHPDGYVTQLTNDASDKDNFLLVQDASKVTAGWWVNCIVWNNWVTRKINKIGHHHGYGDTLYLDKTLGVGPFTTWNTKIKFATYIQYKIIDGKLCRINNGTVRTVSTTIDTLDLIVKDDAGNPLSSSSIAQGRTLSVTFGGHYGSGNQKGVQVEKVDVNLRNNI